MVDVGGPAQRRALAALLTSPGEVVRLDSLVDAVWGDRVPVSAVRTLQASLSRLRRGITPVTIERAAGGYRLHTDPSSVDWQVLSEAASGDDREALRRALGLWRERPFPELVDWGPAAALTSRLVEMRSSALERVLRKELLGSDPAIVLPELEALVTEDPFRERLWVLLVDALRLAGRHGDALAAYDRALLVINEELGVEPSTQLLAARQRTVDETATVGTLLAAGRPLPTSRTALIGRETELDEIITAMANRRLVTLTGIGGVGKTRLALAAAAQAQATFSSGVYWLDLASISDQSGLVSCVSTAIGWPGGADEHEPTFGQLGLWLAARHLLLVLDNCEHVIEEAAEFVDRLMDSGDCCVVLATSRERLNVEGEAVIPVFGLSIDVAAELLALRAREIHGSVDTLGTHDSSELCRSLDGLPLAIELAAAQLDHLSLSELRQRLEDRFELLSQDCRRGRRRRQTLTGMMDWSWSLLDAPEQSFLARLSVFRGGFTAEAAMAVANKSSVVSLLRRLKAKSLITTSDHPTGRRFGLLETVRLYAARKLSEYGQADEAHDRHLDWALGFGEQLAAGIHTTDEAAWVTRTDVEMANLLAASEWAFQRAEIDRLLRLLELIEPECFLRLRPDLGPLVARLIDRLDQTDDDRLGIALSISFRLGQGSIHPSEIWRTLGADVEQELLVNYPTSRLWFGARLGHQGSPTEAAEIIDPLADILRSTGQPGEAARIQAATAVWKAIAGDPTAIDTALQAVERCRQDAGAGSLAWALMICGSAHSRAGQIEASINYCSESIRLAAAVRAANAEKVAIEVRAIAATQLNNLDHDQALGFLLSVIEFTDRPLSNQGRWQSVAAVSIGLGRLGYVDGVIESWAGLDQQGQQMMWPTDRIDVNTVRNKARTEWGDTQYAYRVQSAAHWSADQALTALRQTIDRARQRSE